jgi:hypothetical protein
MGALLSSHRQHSAVMNLGQFRQVRDAMISDCLFAQIFAAILTNTVVAGS